MFKIILILLAFSIALAKELLLFNDTLMILLIFATIFIYLVFTSLASQFTFYINLLLSEALKFSEKIKLSSIIMKKDTKFQYSIIILLVAALLFLASSIIILIIYLLGTFLLILLPSLLLKLLSQFKSLFLFYTYLLFNNKWFLHFSNLFLCFLLALSFKGTLAFCSERIYDSDGNFLYELPFPEQYVPGLTKEQLVEQEEAFTNADIIWVDGDYSVVYESVEYYDGTKETVTHVKYTPDPNPNTKKNTDVFTIVEIGAKGKDGVYQKYPFSTWDNPKTVIPDHVKIISVDEKANYAYTYDPTQPNNQKVSILDSSVVEAQYGVWYEPSTSFACDQEPNAPETDNTAKVKGKEPVGKEPVGKEPVGKEPTAKVKGKEPLANMAYASASSVKTVLTSYDEAIREIDASKDYIQFIQASCKFVKDNFENDPKIPWFGKLIEANDLNHPFYKYLQEYDCVPKEDLLYSNLALNLKTSFMVVAQYNTLTFVPTPDELETLYFQSLYRISTP